MPPPGTNIGNPLVSTHIGCCGFFAAQKTRWISPDHTRHKYFNLSLSLVVIKLTLTRMEVECHIILVKLLSLIWPRLCRIEIQVRSNLDRDHFLVWYLVRRASFWVSIMHKILFPHCGRYSAGSPEPRTCIGAGFGDPKLLYRAQPLTHPAISKH